VFSSKTIGRLSLYRRLLKEAQEGGAGHMFSHELAAMARCTPAQVRRDVMTIGFTGSPARGYAVADLVAQINAILDAPAPENAILVGIGNLGRALLAYFVGRNPRYSIVAGFDTDLDRVNRVIHGCRCYPVEELAGIVREKGIRLALNAVPAGAAQDMANMLCTAGIRGIVNFAPVHLWTPPGVYVENVDVTMALERVAFFARMAPA